MTSISTALSSSVEQPLLSDTQSGEEPLASEPLCDTPLASETLRASEPLATGRTVPLKVARRTGDRLLPLVFEPLRDIPIVSDTLCTGDEPLLLCTGEATGDTGEKP